ncbi:hypothetical protein ASF44_16220 [Pseudorhodoferax sp. Leaf274]|nr:hypothetical protein ASF44_16220 [Pseudorhodoferax sp. Leaf274]
MDAAKLSQMALSKLSGVAQTSIGNYLDPDRRAASASGKEPSAKLTEMAKIAVALGMSPWEMLIPLSEAQDAGVEQQAVELAALFREMPASARGTLLEQARLVHKATRPHDERPQPTAPPLGGDRLGRLAA